MSDRHLPSLVVAADWSVRTRKRWMARARVNEQHYEVLSPEPVGRAETLLTRLRYEAGASRPILIGFDFPIGLPVAYAKRAGLASFREGLDLFGKGRWKDFYTISAVPALHRPFFPPASQRKGEYRKVQLLGALGFDSIDCVMRRCERRTPSRGIAECLFWTLGSKQVGRAAIHGWSTVIQPVKDGAQIWPFDGTLPDLLGFPKITIAEIYPGEAYSHLGFAMGGGTGRKKARLADRKGVAGHLLAVGDYAPVRFTASARNWIAGGFQGEDDFDAMVGLLSMLLVVTGKRTSSVPDDHAVKEVEGWILGQEPVGAPGR